MNEAETRRDLIDPKLVIAGWGKDGSRASLEEICPGRVGTKGNGKKADYVLRWRGHRLAVIEAKADSYSPTEGLGQAKDYADLLRCRFAYATNGKRIYRVDMATGDEGYVDRYPTPQELWDETFAESNIWRDRFAAIPFEEKGGAWKMRYYQHNAIDAALEKIASSETRILLTLATGTGKTAIAFQLAHKLFHARWSLSGEPVRRPRILFLADRNILADQAFTSFSTFEDGSMVRITPGEIGKKGKVPKNASLFFTIFQTFMSGSDADGEPAPYFGEYAPDFFDFIVIDECHRGGARDESSWRAILEYFKPAVQLGLTATPRRDANADTYDYFGDPAYSYALKEGIEDGFLTPFKVRQIATTADDYTYVSDDEILSGEAEIGDHFEARRFNRDIIIPEREEYRVRTFLAMMDGREKTLVFCATQDHAAMVRDFVNQHKQNDDPNYCVRVTANDGAIGEAWLRTFQDNDKTIPTILTTSRKLSTGVDARNIRNIVLMRPITSMVEFKQIIGRGTRLYEDKSYFTIIDFVRAHELFNDPDWDGEPVEPVISSPLGGDEDETEKSDDGVGEDGDEDGTGDAAAARREKLVIKLADGKSRSFQYISATTFWGPDGKPMSAAEFVKSLFGVLPELFKDEAELRQIWGDPATRRTLLDGLSERGFAREQLNEIRKSVDADASDLFDVLAYIACAKPPITRSERVTSRKDRILGEYDSKQAEFLDFVLSQYERDGVDELDDQKLPDLLELKYGSSVAGARELGGVNEARQSFTGFQKGLFDSEGD